MKTLITLVLLLASTQTSAFWGTDYSRTTGNNFLTTLFNSASEGDFSISMSFKGKIRSSSGIDGRGNTAYQQNYSYRENYRGHFINLGNGVALLDGMTEREYNTRLSMRDNARNYLDSRFSSRSFNHGKPYLLRTSTAYQPLQLPYNRPLASIN